MTKLITGLCRAIFSAAGATLKLVQQPSCLITGSKFLHSMAHAAKTSTIKL